MDAPSGPDDGALTSQRLVIENVPNMVAMKNGHFKSKILLAFAAAGNRRTAVLRATISCRSTIGRWLSISEGPES
jgi:hypothetical protein